MECEEDQQCRSRPNQRENVYIGQQRPRSYGLEKVSGFN